MHVRCCKPETFGGVIGCLGLHIVRHPALKEHVESGNVKTRIPVLVRHREQIAAVLYLKSCLFLHLAHYPLLASLVEVNKTTGQVESALGWFLTAATNKQFAFVVYYESG